MALGKESSAMWVRITMPVSDLVLPTILLQETTTLTQPERFAGFLDRIGLAIRRTTEKLLWMHSGGEKCRLREKRLLFSSQLCGNVSRESGVDERH
jgi:hypothetical protein